MALVATALIVAALSYGWMVLSGRNDPPTAAPAAEAIQAPQSEIDPAQPLADIDRAIAVWTANLDRDGADFIAAIRLGELYLGRARITSDPADLDRALEAASQARAANPGLAAAGLLDAQVRLAQHDFHGALGAADALLAADPSSGAALAVRGDALVELGDYAAAADAYASIPTDIAGPAVTARLARLESLTGNLDEARLLASAAAADAVGDPDRLATEIAWYRTLEGSLAFQAGDLPAAAEAYETAIDAWPGSAAALAGLGRTRAAIGDVDAAIDAYRRSVAIVPSIDALAALGDLLTLAGRTDEAAVPYAQVDAVAELAGGLNDRQLAIFLANHETGADRAVEIASADLERRADVYAHDAFAWALYADGRLEEASRAIASAREAGTEDALLDYHDGMIAAALGRDDEARTLLERALGRNPGFDPLQAARARATLAELENGR
jgi:tetratricopeptide (TPR) repeat protein